MVRKAAQVAAAILFSMAVSAGGVLLTAGMTRADEAGPSFDCAKASQPAEKAICADPRLGAADRLMAKLYPLASKTSAFGRGPSDEPKAQRAWLKDRDTCLTGEKAGVNDCILNAYNRRNGELAVTALASDPKTALDTLKTASPSLYPLYEALSVSMNLPAGDDWSVAGQEADRAKIAKLAEPFMSAFQTDDDRSYGRDILKDAGINTAEDVAKSEKAFVTFLNVTPAFASDGSESLTIPCAAILKRPALLNATASVFGSTLDNFVPSTDCVQSLPPLPKLDELDARILKTWPDCEGTIRFAAYRAYAQSVDLARLGLQEDETARQETGKRPKSVSAALVTSAQKELAAYYATYRGLSPDKSSTLAVRMIDNIIANAHQCGG